VNVLSTRREFLATTLAAGLAAPLSAADKPKVLVLIAGTPSHGPGAHEFNAGTALLASKLKGVPGLEVRFNKSGWPKDETIFDGADGIFIYCDGGPGHPILQWNRLELLGGMMKKGVGLMCAHYGVEVPKDKGANELRDWIGGCYEHEFSCNPMWKPKFETFPDHPIARGVKPFAVDDEWYFNMRFRPEMTGVTPILSAVPSDAVRNGPYVYPRGPYKHIQDAKGRSEHMMWATERTDGGRGIGFTGGHVHTNWKNDNYRKVVLNALLWLVKLDVPKEGFASTVSDEEIVANMDPKGKK
jgi:Trehalose utilisation